MTQNKSGPSFIRLHSAANQPPNNVNQQLILNHWTNFSYNQTTSVTDSLQLNNLRTRQPTRDGNTMFRVGTIFLASSGRHLSIQSSTTFPVATCHRLNSNPRTKPRKAFRQAPQQCILVPEAGDAGLANLKGVQKESSYVTYLARQPTYTSSLRISRLARAGLRHMEQL